MLMIAYKRWHVAEYYAEITTTFILIDSQRNSTTVFQDQLLLTISRIRACRPTCPCCWIDNRWVKSMGCERSDCDVDTWNSVGWYCNRIRSLIIALPMSNVSCQEASSPLPRSIKLHGDPGWRLGVVGPIADFRRCGSDLLDWQWRGVLSPES